MHALAAYGQDSHKQSSSYCEGQGTAKAHFYEKKAQAGLRPFHVASYQGMHESWGGESELFGE